MEGGGRGDPARGARSAVPRHRRPDARVPARSHRRRGRRARRAARAHSPRLAAPSPQPARDLRQAPSAPRAARPPRVRSLPARAMRLPDVRVLHHRARRLARRAGSIGYRTIIVPLLEREETEHALDLACRLAAERRARVVLVAPLFVDRELPLDARFDTELRVLRDRLDSAEAVAASYGVGA